MKLREIWAICNVVITANAYLNGYSGLANDSRSDRTPFALSLAANLQPINTTHVNVSITNTYSEQISILKWNNHFQTNQNAAHGSFQLSQRSLNGSTQRIGPGSRMGRFRYLNPLPSHYFNLTAGATYINSFDITYLFDVPDNRTYHLTMDFSSPAVLVPDEVKLSRILEEASPRKGENKSSSLPTARIKSDTVSVDLQASSPAHMLQKRDTRNMCTSQGQSASAVLKARGHARSLARFAQEKALPPMGIAAHGVSSRTFLFQLH